MHQLFSRQNNPRSVWAARVLIAIVLFWNLQAAVHFMLKPAVYAPSFQLQGVPGQVAIAGYGILFLMWQVPYVFAVLHPGIFKISLWSALIMQVIGVIAESLLLSTIPGDYTLLRGSITRFIIFDGAGVPILLGALVLVRREKCHSNPQSR
ncbi:MAG TPA: hypothetical protein PLA02_00935 [Brevefilum fermentans]|jgi:hypothetical protein|uniref:Uncharacterized protein n=1 Tax=Candidatus Brevifilum fermentans TaxID=1986204 RepID=A0A1Y6K9Y5_9CHLR|nr:hypothetical protein [Brevefilum fermentans]MDI9565940.1 hypothetical protein [Chloroflexota bacterium]OQB87285.1 MAG: hypothetical protein BWX85_00373 [Chloroflexi bacterium ADurb.Bin120]SMX54840.1 conserved membrane protein of unknown function [Brevefilum fermentans]HOM66518.1 hypothetical protein [Brevefilum fermentans]HPX94992.1 hypothetical protein [Brevefilum fermentans]